MNPEIDPVPETELIHALEGHREASGGGTPENDDDQD